LNAIACAVRRDGVPVLRCASLSGDAAGAGESIASALRDSAPGVLLYGGETTVKLPPVCGTGGRNQHLALSAALRLQDVPNVLLLALGTDGIDGVTPDAGACVDGASVERMRRDGVDARSCLAGADSHRALAASGDLVNTGATGT